MPKPLLTDEVIEQANQEKKNLERRLQRELEEDSGRHAEEPPDAALFGDHRFIHRQGNRLHDAQSPHGRDCA